MATTWSGKVRERSKFPYCGRHTLFFEVLRDLFKEQIILLDLLRPRFESHLSGDALLQLPSTAKMTGIFSAFTDFIV